MGNQQPSRQTNSGGFSLGEILMVMVLVLAITGGILYLYVGKDNGGMGKNVLDAPNVAKDVVCRTNLQTVRSSIEAARAKDSNGKAPASLDDLGLGEAATRCPVGNEPYEYDPATGLVHCQHPGHEKY